ncbi:ABC transporter permease [Ancylobacter sp. GSK1Z-4-2]|nr:ABC transporter permease [Ancylobacter mangrovi]
MPSTSRPSFTNWLIIPAGVVAVTLASAMFVLFQSAFREAIPGSLEVGGFTLANFGRLLRPIYLQAFLDTLWFAAICSVANLLLGYPLAYVLVRTRSPSLKSAILVITLMPLFTGDIVRTYGWLAVLGKYGFLNSSLMGLGLISEPLELLYTATGVVIALVQYSMPIMVIILSASISHVDPSLERAARGLGASPVRAFLLVTLPLSLPGIVSGVLTIFAWTLSAFSTPQIIGGGKVNTIATLIYNVGFSNFNFPFAAALSLTSLVMIFLLLGIIGTLARRALTVPVAT